ncbi:MAG TPA: NAD-dependent epimerase/dehydratase family protein [Hyphomicrobiaceae bacterium]|nr:NAD-dependent epimerase/dehydratase family protein [Hyphomicrobiaceae bacterium]
MKILVTGSEGSLMQAVIPHLLARGHEVLGVDNFFRYGRIERERSYQLIEGDLSDDAFVRRIMTNDIEGVIQGAARIFGVSGFHAYPADILGRDVTLHQNILYAAKELKSVRRVVYISSSMVYERCETVPSREEDVDDMRIPYTDYGLSKLVGERLSRAFQRQFGLDFTIWRPFNIITPFERAEAEPGFSHVFADFIERLIIKRENPLAVIGDGEQVRCFTWIGDIASAIAEFSFDERTKNETFNLGNPEPTKMKELAQLIFKIGQEKGAIAGGKPLTFGHLPTFPDDVRIRVPSVDKAAKVLGWKPQVKTEESVRRCVDQAMAIAGTARPA